MKRSPITNKVLKIMQTKRFLDWDEFVEVAGREGLDIRVEAGEVYFTTHGSEHPVPGSQVSLGRGRGSLDAAELKEGVKEIAGIWAEAPQGFTGSLGELVALQEWERRTQRSARRASRESLGRRRQRERSSLSPARERSLEDRSFGG